jgi:hypothetical protein
MSQFVDIIHVGKEKAISNEKASDILNSFITANSGSNADDAFDETKIVNYLYMTLCSSWTMLLLNN